jgi:hypothetical protein
MPSNIHIVFNQIYILVPKYNTKFITTLENFYEALSYQAPEMQNYY